MPHQILHETKTDQSMQRRLLLLLLSADDRNVHEGRKGELGYFRRCRHSIWSKVTIEEAQELAAEIEGWL